MTSDGDGGDRREGASTATEVDPALADTVERSPGEPPQASPADVSIGVGEVLAGRFKILEKLGEGGEGAVFRALDARADVVVAIKLLRRDAAKVERFRRELQMARRVTHPNVVRIYDLVDLPDRFGLSMEYVRGETLEGRLEREGPLSVADLRSLALDLAHGLAAAHEAGVIHRDLKPSNVILREGGGDAIITDFGIARSNVMDAPSPRVPAHTPAGVTTVDGIVGTPLYMAPEQFVGGAGVDTPADVYAFGLVLREAAVGRPLHDDLDAAHKLLLARTKPPRPILEERSDVPPELARVIDRCLSPDPVDRYRAGPELVSALLAVPDAEKRTILPGRSSRGGRIRAVIGVAVGLTGAAAFAYATLRHRAPPATAFVAESTHPSFQVTGARRITFGKACDAFPSFTPDGSAVIYDETEGADDNLMEMDLHDLRSRALTDLPGWSYGASFSPDGRAVAFHHDDAGASGIYVMDFPPAKPPRRLSDGGFPTWAPDGGSVWAHSGGSFVRYDLATGAEVERLELPTGLDANLLLASTGGNVVFLGSQLGFDTGAWGLQAMNLYRRASDGSVSRLLEGPLDQTLVAWPDAGHVLVSAGYVLNDSTQLRLVPLDGSPSTLLPTAEIAPRVGLAVSRDRGRVVWSTCRQSCGLAWLGGTYLAGEPGTASWSDFKVAPLPDSSSGIVLSTRGGSIQPWRVDLAEPERATLLPIAPRHPSSVSVSPDGRWLAIGGFDDTTEIHVWPMDGSAQPRVVARDAREPALGGDRLLYTGKDAGGVDRVASVELDGTGPHFILPAYSSGPSVSRDGRILYLQGTEGSAERRPMIFEPRTGSSRELSPHLGPGNYGMVRISPDGARAAVFRGYQEIIEVDTAAGTILRRTKEDDRVIDAAYVRGRLLLVKSTWAGGLMLADLGSAR